MDVIKCKQVDAIIASTPAPVQQRLTFLRQLIFEAASELENLNQIEETIKWGEPAYLSKHGSTLRYGWKQSKPEQYAMYFHCKSRLVDTFKEVYGDCFKFEGNRAIIFNVKDDIPVNELKHCISLSLNYHKLKQLPMLGI